MCTIITTILLPFFHSLLTKGRVITREVWHLGGPLFTSLVGGLGFGGLPKGPKVVSFGDYLIEFSICAPKRNYFGPFG